jgi:hypothetical protein
VTSLHSYGGGSRSRASSVSERDLNGGAGRVETKRHLHTSGPRKTFRTHTCARNKCVDQKVFGGPRPKDKRGGGPWLPRFSLTSSFYGPRPAGPDQQAGMFSDKRIRTDVE